MERRLAAIAELERLRRELAAAQSNYDRTLPTDVDSNNIGGGGSGPFGLQMLSTGGMVKPKYFSVGGLSRGTDTVPAMLTPGEFVMNKKATKAFGPMLAAMNGSKFSSMLSKGMSAPTYQTPSTNIIAPSNISNSNSINNNSSSVYNYSVGINVSGTNLNSQDIAREVMTQIKNVDAQRIRSQRA